MNNTFTKRRNRWSGMLLLALGFWILPGLHAQDFVENEEGLVVMEAENHSQNIMVGTAEWVPTEEPAGFSGSGGMLALTDGPFASAADALEGSGVLVFSVEFIYPGPHYIWARASRTLDNPGGTDSFHAGLGQDIPESSTFINFEEAFGEEGDGIWKWIWWSNPTGGHAYVDIPSPGVYEFEVYMRENNFRIDKVVLSQLDYQEGMGYGPPPDNIPETRGATRITLSGEAPVFSFHPNPATDRVRVRFSGDEPAGSRMLLLDISGKELMQWSAPQNGDLELDLGHLESGMYLLELRQGKQARSVSKLLKL